MKAEMLIRKSIEYAFTLYPSVSDYVKLHSQTMSEEVMRKHIDLYVNDYSVSIGQSGKKAIEKMYELFLTQHTKLIPTHSSTDLFLSLNNFVNPRFD